MRLGTYRFVVVLSILSSFLAGFHLPALHDMMEHGAAPRIDVLLLTAFFVVCTLAGAWTLLRTSRAGHPRVRY